MPQEIFYRPGTGPLRKSRDRSHGIPSLEVRRLAIDNGGPERTQTLFISMAVLFNNLGHQALAGRSWEDNTSDHPC